MSNKAVNMRGRKKNHSLKLSRIEAEIEAETKDGYMPNPVTKEEVADILAKRAIEDQGGPQTIGDIYPALTG